MSVEAIAYIYSSQSFKDKLRNLPGYELFIIFELFAVAMVSNVRLMCPLIYVDHSAYLTPGI